MRYLQCIVFYPPYFKNVFAQTGPRKSGELLVRNRIVSHGFGTYLILIIQIILIIRIIVITGL